MKIIICDPEYKLIEVVPSISKICDEVIVITDSDNVANICETLSNVAVVFGNPTSPSILKRINTSLHSRVIAMTDSDASNILIAQIANCNTNAGKVISVVSNEEYCSTYLGDNFSSDITLISSNKILVDMIVNKFLYPSIADISLLHTNFCNRLIIEITLPNDSNVIGMNLDEFHAHIDDVACIGSIDKQYNLKPITHNYLFKAQDRIVILINADYDMNALCNKLNLHSSYKNIVIASQNINIANAVGEHLPNAVQAICLKGMNAVKGMKADNCDVITGDIKNPDFVNSIEHFYEKECMFFHLDDDQSVNILGASLTCLRGYPSFVYANHGLHKKIIQKIGAYQIPFSEKMTGLLAMHSALCAIKFIRLISQLSLLCVIQYNQSDVFVGENKVSELRYYKTINAVLGVIRDGVFLRIAENDYIMQNDLIIFTIESSNFAKLHRIVSML